MDDRAGRVVLGTAQLGMEYGVANHLGMPSPANADALLELAWLSGVTCWDTAQAYGHSEEVIGSYLECNPDCQVRVISKLDPKLAGRSADEVYRAVIASAERVAGRLDAMLLHNSSMLKDWENGLGDALERCRDEGIIATIGASVYTTDEFRRALAQSEIRLIQAPFNVLDRALFSEGLFEQAQNKGVEIHLRSIFLQGLLVMDTSQLPSEMSFAYQSISEWQGLCRRLNRLPADVALQFACQTVPDAFLVLGCETQDQLARNLQHLDSTPLEPEALDHIMSLQPTEERVIRPYLWN